MKHRKHSDFGCLPGVLIGNDGLASNISTITRVIGLHNLNLELNSITQADHSICGFAMQFGKCTGILPAKMRFSETKVELPGADRRWANISNTVPIVGQVKFISLPKTDRRPLYHGDSTIKHKDEKRHV